MMVLVENWGRLEASPVDVVRLIASSLGIEDVDIEPGVGSRVTIFSSLGPVAGRDLYAACIEFLEKARSRA